MAEETKTVTTNDGTVTFPMEKYNQLLEKAREKPPIIHRTVIRTPEMVADANMLWGGSLMALGAVIFAVGVVQLRVGIVQAAKLKP